MARRGTLRAQVVSIFIAFYRVLVGPALRALGGLGQECRFHPSCSEYARQAFLMHPTGKAFVLSATRIFKCNPWGSSPFFDPVPGITRRK